MSGKAKFLSIVAVLIVIVSFVAYQFMMQLNTLSSVNAQAAAKHDALNTANAQAAKLQQDIKDSQTDSWVERIARDMLGWVKPGDVKIVDKDK